ncbi:EAL domain-containing protein [Undibacterium aquatile]|uniref:EAL domain-containing protein n=1 Tax=Undibacterium aquatile TaxID=1537398 RepID=A0ABR6XAH7_9BURK|nr:EAL domain-containing protein [Undibacterium aquatile]MBC3809934.1 EAL domain-containing protein [Undibacterium aquatile]
MRPFESLIQAWLALGAYTRLFVPITLLIFVVSGLRYDLLIHAEVAGAKQQILTHAENMEHLLGPTLLKLSKSQDQTEITNTLRRQLANDPDLTRLTWSYPQSNVDMTGTFTVPMLAPQWFQAILQMPATLSKTITTADKNAARVTVEISTNSAVNRIWQKVVVQLQISAMAIFFIYFLLGLILRVNERSWKRLALATNRFKTGDHGVRMDVRGSHEERLLATTFNGMAEEIESILLTLQKSQREQSEQMHFTLQLLNALPVSTFFQDSQGICRGVNPAWCKMFGIHQKDAVGQPMHKLLPFLATLDTRHISSAGLAICSHKTIPDIPRQVNGEHISALYYQATYTSVDGKASGIIGALVDISERKKIQAALEEQKERVETTLDSIDDAVISADIDGRILTLNRSAQKLTGWRLEEALSQELATVFTLGDSRQQTALHTYLTNVVSTGATFQEHNLALLSRAGRQLEVDLSAAPIRQPDGTVTGSVLVFRDLSETHYLMRQIAWQAGHDLLTGLANRQSLSAHFSQAIAYAREHHKLLAVCLLDLDHFQEVNDKHGNEVADKLLQQVARRLESCVGKNNPVARLGGDEFVVLLQNQSDLNEVELNIALLLGQLAQPYEFEHKKMTMRASIGVAMYPNDELSPDVLLRYADQAMYQAKLSGRNQYHLFDLQKDEEVRTRHNQRARIREALLTDEFELYFQPKVDMRHGRITGMEALIRWNHPQRGIVGPMEFLPLVENTNIIIDIGNWVIHQTLQQMSNWIANGYTWVVSVNIAARHFQHADFLENLRSYLAQFPDVPPEYLEIEILESAALQDVQQVREVMSACQQLGVRFALDDFGTGYSSLSYLKRLPANILKIDQSFVRDMLEDSDDLALISAIVGLANAFKREVIAEGVETIEHGVALMRLGCNFAQGYGVSRPMPASRVEKWAENYVQPEQWLQQA